MNLPDHRSRSWLLRVCSLALLLTLSVNQQAQTTPKIPPPTGHVNDFAGVVDAETKQYLENVLANVKRKTGIEFDIAMVESTGGRDIFDFSRELARDWNVGARTSVKKSLLLVVSVNDKVSFTQFSKTVQNDLPEGVLGEMGQLMRRLVDAGRFNEGLKAGVQHFVSELGQKLAFTTDDFDKTPQVASVTTPVTHKPSTQPTDEA